MHTHEFFQGEGPKSFLVTKYKNTFSFSLISFFSPNYLTDGYKNINPDVRNRHINIKRFTLSKRLNSLLFISDFREYTVV